MTLILICEMMTKRAVAAIARVVLSKTCEKPIRYIWFGSTAFSAGTPLRRTSQASSAPPSILRTPGTTQPGPPTMTPVHQRSLVAGVFSRHEAQVIDLFRHLRDQRDADGQRRAEQVRVESRAAAMFAAVLPQPGQYLRLFDEDEGVGQHEEEDPQRLRPRLKLADRGDAVGDQRNDDQRADQVTPRRRNPEGQFQRISHDRRLEGEEDEGEGGVDQRGDRRADVAETGAACQQVHVQPVPRRHDADRQAEQEDDQASGEDRPERIDEPSLQQHRRADRFQHEKRGRAERGVGDPHLRPLAETAGGEAQRVIFERLIGDPGVVVATNLDDTLNGIGARGAHCWNYPSSALNRPDFTGPRYRGCAASGASPQAALHCS